jgi:hypothetical protein
MPGTGRFLTILLLGFLLLPFPCHAENLTFISFFEAGKRSQAEDFQEEEDDSDYTFRNYHLRLRHTVSDIFNYEFGTYIYDKNYSERDDLDNYSRLFHARGIYYFKKQKQRFSKLDVKLKYKVKRYDETPSSEYDQIAFSPKITYTRKNLYTLKISGGINSYDYRSADSKDQFKVYSKLDARVYLFERNLTLLSSYKFEITAETKKNRNKNKNDFLSGFDYRINAPLIQKVSARFSLGQRDTKEDDMRDEDFDYTFRRFYIKTEHKLQGRVKTDLRYQYFKKDYVSADLDHSGFSLRNGWRVKIHSDSIQELYGSLSAQHKHLDYTIKPGSDYVKETFIVRGTYRRKKNWKASASLQGSFYDFDDSSKDKNRYYARISIEKYLLNKALILYLHLKYKLTDYKKKNDTEVGSARMALQYRF